ncbi:hypothetical protein DASC09_017190 [Saccharomycopsis crataegensis]|uniref:Uncharacterized protein n=1 Tax=Saccharomycopsis crataegensis TaxID=43959 RepID=A0AAV5QIZ5_9ASCO|nr:hypothetical protein DASC09_017190 [Saccharomycopsis crataegensis]
MTKPDIRIDDSNTITSYKSATHLVMLPCHAIYKGSGNGKSFKHWYMEEFQKEGNDNIAWMKQIETCLDILTNNKDAIVIISGGKTKKVGNISESFSYLNLIMQNKSYYEEKYLDLEGLIDRIYLEEYARDSLDNMLYSLYRFKEICGRFPDQTTIVGYEFKRDRFVEYHAKAVGYNDPSKVKYVGIDPCPDYPRESPEFKKFYSDLQVAEWEHAVKHFQIDPLANDPDGVLVAKKRKRNPYNTRAPYHIIM